MTWGQVFFLGGCILGYGNLMWAVVFFLAGGVLAFVEGRE